MGNAASRGRVLSLVGMSGVGKSHWASRLETRGWVRLGCDDAIARELSSLVELRADEEPVHALGRWMGMPWTPGHRERERAYLELEARVTSDALSRAVELSHAGRDVVVDCTGSVVYLPREVRDELRRTTEVVHLRVPDARHAAMLARYLAEPKPVVWDGLFAAQEGESETDALARLYPALLALREQRYAALAHRSLDAGWLETGSEARGVEAIVDAVT